MNIILNNCTIYIPFKTLWYIYLYRLYMGHAMNVSKFGRIETLKVSSQTTQNPTRNRCQKYVWKPPKYLEIKQHTSQKQAKAELTKGVRKYFKLNDGEYKTNLSIKENPDLYDLAGELHQIFKKKELELQIGREKEIFSTSFNEASITLKSKSAREIQNNMIYKYKILNKIYTIRF